MPNAREDSDPDDLHEYVAECDEHLSIARKVLLDFDAASDLSSIKRESLDELFRAFHTIKGLSGMVGARPAEDAAHRLESYLGAVRKGDTTLTEPGIDALLEGVKLVELAVNAFSTGGQAPDTTGLAARVASLLPHAPLPSLPPADHARGVEPTASATLETEKLAKLEGARLRGLKAWQIHFTPSPALAARGINVGTVRARLQGIGEIVHAEPVSTPGGVRFRFLVTLPPDTDVSRWADEGITAEPNEPSSEVTRSSEKVHSQRLPTATSGIATTHLVRVDLGRLDDLLRAVGELVLGRARLQRGLERVAKYLPLREQRDLDEAAQAIERQLRDLREGIMRVRMVPVGDLFTRMRLVVRDLIKDTGKDVEIEVSGEQTEVDKYIVERMADPLLHLVRNAVSHGLESSQERTAAGKPATGRVTLRAVATGGMIVLEVEDDGRGIRTDEIVARGREMGLVPPNTPADPAVILDLICTPGFSTRDQADRASGRGVGLDVVRLAVEAVGGSLTLDTRLGAGSRFTVRLPLTMLVADVLTVAVGDQTYAIPQTAVREVMPIEPDATTVLEKNELVHYHDGALPLIRLGDLFGSPRPVGSFVAMVIGEGTASIALGVDRALGLREVVVRSLTDPLVQVPGIGGATELGDGRPILILDPVGLGRFARRGSAARSQTGE